MRFLLQKYTHSILILENQKPLFIVYLYVLPQFPFYGVDILGLVPYNEIIHIQRYIYTLSELFCNFISFNTERSDRKYKLRCHILSSWIGQNRFNAEM